MLLWSYSARLVAQELLVQLVELTFNLDALERIVMQQYDEAKPQIDSTVVNDWPTYALMAFRADCVEDEVVDLRNLLSVAQENHSVDGVILCKLSDGGCVG